MINNPLKSSLGAAASLKKTMHHGGWRPFRPYWSDMPWNPTSDRSRILVVDDSEDTRLFVTAILEEAGHEVLTAADGARGLELARGTQPSLILLDVMMPGMDGYEMCTRLKADEATFAIPVIFISVLHNSAAETRGFELGAADFITKPIGTGVLRARVNAQLALHAQRRSLEGMFRDVIEFAPDAIILVDEQGSIVQVNARAEVLFGYARQELIGRPAEMLVSSDSRGAHHQRRAWILAQSRGTRMETHTRCLRKDGSEFEVDASVSVLHAFRGPLMVAMVRDATQRIAQQDRLREAARYARSLIETSMDPMVLIDLKGKVQDANAAACCITGLSREQLLGSDAQAYFTDPLKLVEGFRQVMAEGQALGYELTIRHASGRTRDVRCNAKAFRNEQGEVVGLFASAHDVTESRRFEQELRDSRQRLREMAAQGDALREYERKNIAREVHDELGQVLTALRMDLTFVDLRHGEQVAELRPKLHGMRTLVDRAIQGVRNVAANLRPAALDMGLIPAIEWLCGEFRRSTGIACTVEVETPEFELAEDRAIGLFRIVQESLTNVTRYARARQVGVSLRIVDASLELQVRDDGRGFDPAQAQRPQSFGLLGMQERAMALGGVLELDSAPGQGTRVRVLIPLQHGSYWQELS